MITPLKPLDVTSRQLAELDPESAVGLLRELLWAEATRTGIGKNLISVPTAITVADGGVDAEVRDAPIESSQGIFSKGLTRYQVKTGGCSLSTDADVMNILCKPRRPGKKRELNARVKSCLDKKGKLVVVLFGWDLPDRTDSPEPDSILKFRQVLLDLDESYADASIEIWAQNKIMGFLSPFPSLRLHLLHGQHLWFHTHDVWSKSADMQGVWHPGQKQDDFVNAVRDQLRRSDGHCELRVIGEPGIGKTRAVLEALRPDDLHGLVLYCDSPQGVLQSDLVRHMIMCDADVNAILVVDECDFPSKALLWNSLRSESPRVKLISIYNEPDPSRGPDGYLDPKPLDPEQIVDIIASYGTPRQDSSRFVPFCDGSPRVAHVIGQNLLHSPDDLLRPLSEVDVWNRFIADREPVDGVKHRERKKVLLWLSLFKKFGYEKPYGEEVDQIAKKVELAEGIARGDFNRIVRELRGRKLLQGRTTLYITPRLFHIWLWSEWWEINKHSFDLDKFRVVDASAAPPTTFGDQLIGWFHDMFRYATSSETSSVVTDLLGVNGPFSFEYLETREGSSFFQSLSEADPRTALGCLKRALGRRSREELLAFHKGRRVAVHALELMAEWQDLFVDAARLLLALGAAENESWSNNASGAFADLFSLVYGEAAPTEASPSARLPVLREALSSDIKERRLLGIRAADRALETNSTTRIVRQSDPWLEKRRPKGWQPLTYKELFDAFRQVWGMLSEQLDSLEPDEQEAGVKALLESARGLVRIANLADMVADTLVALVNKPYVKRKDLLDTVLSVIQYVGRSMPDSSLERWRSLEESLSGADFLSRLKRYVGMSQFQDNLDRDGNLVDQLNPRLQELAIESVETPSLLIPELHWLVLDGVENGYRFGYELGLADDGADLLPILTRSQSIAPNGGNTYFLGGYFHALRERDVVQWEEQLDNLIGDAVLTRQLPELSWRSGKLTDRAAARILALAEAGSMETQSFATFTVGGTLDGLSEQMFLRWIAFLSQSSDPVAHAIALNLFISYFLYGNASANLPYNQTLSLLTHKNFFEEASGASARNTDQFGWTRLAQRFISQFPEGGILLAEKILEQAGNDHAITSGFHSEAMKVLNAVTERYPEEIWRIVEKFVGPPLDARAYHVGVWLHGEDLFDQTGPGALEAFPAQLIWNWIDADIDARAWYGAHIVPKALFHSKDRTCLAREMLARYGARHDVRSEMTANQYSGGWEGPISLHFEAVKQHIQGFRSEESNESVLLWVDEYIDYLNVLIADAKGQEERRGY